MTDASVDGLPLAPRIHPALIVAAAASLGGYAVLSSYREDVGLPVMDCSLWAIGGGALAGLVAYFRLPWPVPLSSALALAGAAYAGPSQTHFTLAAFVVWLLTLSSLTRARSVARSLDATARSLAIAAGWLAVACALTLKSVNLGMILATAGAATCAALFAALADARLHHWLDRVRAGQVAGWSLEDATGDVSAPDSRWLLCYRIGVRTPSALVLRRALLDAYREASSPGSVVVALTPAARRRWFSLALGIVQGLLRPFATATYVLLFLAVGTVFSISGGR